MTAVAAVACPSPLTADTPATAAPFSLGVPHCGQNFAPYNPVQHSAQKIGTSLIGPPPVQDPRESERVLLFVNGASVAVDETTREVNERHGLPRRSLRERFEQ